MNKPGFYLRLLASGLTAVGVLFSGMLAKANNEQPIVASIALGARGSNLRKVGRPMAGMGRRNTGGREPCVGHYGAILRTAAGGQGLVPGRYVRAGCRCAHM